MNMEVQISLPDSEIVISFPSYRNPEVEFLDYIVVPLLNIEKPPYHFP